MNFWTPFSRFSTFLIFGYIFLLAVMYSNSYSSVSTKKIPFELVSLKNFTEWQEFGCFRMSLTLIFIMSDSWQKALPRRVYGLHPIPKVCKWNIANFTLLPIESYAKVSILKTIRFAEKRKPMMFLECSSCVSVVAAANFRLFLNVAIFLKGKYYAVMKTELVSFC